MGDLVWDTQGGTKLDILLFVVESAVTETEERRGRLEKSTWDEHMSTSGRHHGHLLGETVQRVRPGKTHPSQTVGDGSQAANHHCISPYSVSSNMVLRGLMAKDCAFKDIFGGIRIKEDTSQI